MYYPLLRARQFELIAIRELVAENALQGKIMPVLEPIRESLSSLNLANNALIEYNSVAYLILNPLVGEKKDDSEYYVDYISSLSTCMYLPAFNYNHNSEFIESIISKLNFNDCLLVCPSSFIDDDKFRNLCKHPAINSIMIADPQKNRSLDRFIKTLNKNYIRLDDIFLKQEKNADFLEIPAHKFTEEHLYYKEDGYSGFSDYTVLPSEYIEGGSTPRAVAIHLTYLNSEEENQIWIRHFTSETNDSIANVQGKFEEAAIKAIEFCNKEGLTNAAINELRLCLVESRYPGLGTVKKISIKNHLLVVGKFLNS